MRRHIPAAIIAVPAAVLVLAACGPAASSGSSPPASPAATAPPSPSPAAPVKVAGNITIAPADGALPGPEKLTFLSCGKLTAAQQQQFATNATTGLVYKFTNQAAYAAFPQVAVNFLDGSTVVASNVSDGAAALIGPGQSEAGEVDTGQVGPQPKFTSCEIMDYLLIAAPGVTPTQYAG